MSVPKWRERREDARTQLATLATDGGGGEYRAQRMRPERWGAALPILQVNELNKKEKKKKKKSPDSNLAAASNLTVTAELIINLTRSNLTK